MGNSGSGAGRHGDKEAQTQGRVWPHPQSHSYPRPGHKVLPERVPGQRLQLRHTHNGNILHSGGTLTNRKHLEHQSRPRSSSQGSQYELPKGTFYGSEPDLRFSGRDLHNYNDSPAKLRISRSRKKYKAPPAPPNGNGMDSSSPDSYQHWEMTGEVVPPVRRLRLFKTKAESNKRRGDEGVSPPPHTLPSPGPLQRSLSSPHFQVVSPAELQEAAERLRPVREPPVGKAADSPILRSRENFQKPPHNINSPKNDRGRLKANNFNAREIRNNITNLENKSGNVQRNQRSSTSKDEIIVRGKGNSNKKISRGEGVGEMRARGEGSTGKESTPEPVKRHRNQDKIVDQGWGEIKPTTKPTAPVKSFYFGMNEEDLNNSSGAGSEDNREVDRFAASIQRRVPPPPASPPHPSLIHQGNTSGSDSFTSDHNVDEGGPTISLQLRPILPRKQLEIPRFSPTAAWRLLSALESPSPPPSPSDDDLVLLAPLEDRIIHPHHPPPDKSGDSGISGDASPQHQDSTHNSQAAWTPQQDLEETSSDGGLESAPLSPESLSLPPLAKFSPRFSLSLPRDDRLAIYTQSDKIKEDVESLKKLKRTMSGALGRSVAPKEPLDTNWVLSRSVPNSLNNGNASLSLHRWSSSSPSSPDQEDELSLVKQPSFSYLATGGHVMYLPEYSMPHSQRERDRTPAALTLSKSCEDLSQKEQLAPSVLRALEPRAKGKKFTFQSTVRQIERRRLAEKLSKEAEQKERQRLNELEAMRRVEEEFQRKREREKADIRQQLRLFSLTQGRAQPDGIDAPPPPATQVLSEFRQSRRDYRDYTPHTHRYPEEPVVETPKKSTVHPQVVYQMPKSTQVYVNPHMHSNSGSGVGSNSNDGGERGGVSTPRSSTSDNYRRNFAQGALPHSLVSSDSELSQPNTRPTSRTRHRSRSASPGRREPSPLPHPVPGPGEITLHLTQLKILERSATPSAGPSSLDTDSGPMTSLDTNTSASDAASPTVDQVDKPSMAVPRLGLSSLAQPFARSPKTFRPITFNPTPNKLAQIAM